MLNQEKVFEELVKHGVTFFIGVPDSYLNGFCNYALDNCGRQKYFTAKKGADRYCLRALFRKQRDFSCLYAEQWAGECGESSGKSCG